ncbi:MAG: class I SAM-dependent methyltransferase [Brucellaceae bacterium]|nr:class I SAM-dependent methyltransferase [Brucellaceae bacterium]
MRDAAKTLVLPFEKGALDGPERDDPFLFLDAEPLPGWEALTKAFQDHRGLVLDLEAAGFAAVPAWDGTAGCAGALVLASRFREVSEMHVAQALAGTRPGGLVVVAGEKTVGIASLRKRLGAMVEIEDALAKHHATVFWFRVPDDATRAAQALQPSPPPLVDGRFETGPGVFSGQHTDPGSRLLAEALPTNLGGAVADFGAGWGYLSVEAARRCPGISSLDLFEVSHRALEAARRNMAALAPDMEVRFHWADLTREGAENRRFDAVIMNPPFHAGRSAEPALGIAFIQAASRALKAGGRLFMVANRHLPYEHTLQAAFRRVSVLAEADGFKLFEALR